MPTATKITSGTPLAPLLKKLGACDKAIKWADVYRTCGSAWRACPRADWMCWALDAIGYKHERKITRFKAWCARNTPLHDGRTSWDLLTDERSRRAVEMAERFAAGKATKKEMATAAGAALGAADAAREAAYAARGATESAWGAAYAAREAAYAAWGAADAAREAADAAREAAYAAWGAAYAAREAAYAAREAAGAALGAADAAWGAADAAQANVLRKIIGNPFAKSN